MVNFCRFYSRQFPLTQGKLLSCEATSLKRKSKGTHNKGNQDNAKIKTSSPNDS
jgi:hypothetical protein